MTGRREWVINRLPLSAHTKIMKDIGFHILAEERVERQDGIKKHRLARWFKDMDDTDFQSAQAFVQARK